MRTKNGDLSKVEIKENSIQGAGQFVFSHGQFQGSREYEVEVWNTELEVQV